MLLAIAHQNGQLICISLDRVLPSIHRAEPEHCSLNPVTAHIQGHGVQSHSRSAPSQRTVLVRPERRHSSSWRARPSKALSTDTHGVPESFERAASTWGYPASVLTDNAAIFNARARDGRTIFESELAGLGIVYKHSGPITPRPAGRSSASARR